MKTIKYRLTMEVEFDPAGTDERDLKHNLNRIVRDALNNGTLTGETPATVEEYSFKIEKLSDHKDTCRKCGTPLEHERCPDETCFYSDHEQTTENCTNCGSGIFNPKGYCQVCGL